MARPPAPAAVLGALVLGLVAGCAPELTSGCVNTRNCPAPQICVAATCVPRPGPGDPDTSAEMDGAGPSDAPADARPPADTGGPPDARMDADADPPRTDALSPPDARSDVAVHPTDALADTHPAADLPLAPDADPPADAAPDAPCVPEEEVCNGRDDDCDQAIDEDEPGEGPLLASCYDAPPETEDVGECHGGIALCEGGAYGPCGGQALPADEICDGLDNDCDGEVDDAPGVGVPCGAGVGACVRSGVWACSEAKQPVCTAEPGAPGTEVCNGLDDDCDGAVDDGFSLGADCAVGRGECVVVGRIVCAPDGTPQCNATPDPPTGERCDALDNDCDGEVDEGIGKDDACTVGVGVCRATGRGVCDEYGEVVCDAVPLPPRPAELCNAEDDTCDGNIDEGFVTGAPCEAGIGACRQQGLTVSGGTAQPETCNGADDDCDGTPDDGFHLGEVCALGIGACARGGSMVCNGQGGAVCNAAPGAPTPEVCNGLDDNCNGPPDDVTPAVIIGDVPYSTLALYDGYCDGVNERGAAHCNVAAAAWCRALGCYVSAPPPFENVNNVSASVGCLSQGVAEIRVTFAELSGYDMGCLTVDALNTLSCKTAIHSPAVRRGPVWLRLRPRALGRRRVHRYRMRRRPAPYPDQRRDLGDDPTDEPGLRSRGRPGLRRDGL